MFLEVLLGMAALAFLVSKLCKRAWGLGCLAQRMGALQSVDGKGDAGADSSSAVAGTGACEEEMDVGLRESESLQSQFGEGLAAMMMAAMSSATPSVEVPANHEMPEDDEDDEDDEDMPPLEIIGPPRQPASVLPVEEDIMFLPHVEAPEAMPMDESTVQFLRRLDTTLAQTNPAILQLKNAYVRILQAQKAKEEQDAKGAMAALQAKETTAELVQRLVRDPGAIDEFIKNVNGAQLALENMKNFAKDLKVQKILQQAQEAKEAEERHLQAEEEAMKKPAEELEIEDMEILQKRAERMVAEECRAKAFLFRDAGRAQGPLERKVKEGLKRQKTLTLQEALKQHDEAAQRTTQEKQKLDAKIKDLIDAKTMFRRHALDWCSDLCAPEKEALMKSVGELTESDKEALQKMHRRLYEAERLLKEKSKRMIEYLRDDEEALKVLDAREQALMEKPVVDLSASDIQVMVRRAESMIEEKERAIKDPDEPLCTMGGPAKPAEPTSSLRELASTRSPT